MTCNLANPYLDEFYRLRGDMVAADRLPHASLLDADANAFATRRSTRAKFAYAIPTEEALGVIAARAPIIEVGAGLGYWAWLLRARGVDVAAFDVAPPDISDDNLSFPRRPCWTHVEPGDTSILAGYQGHSLLLCWPPRANQMAADALRAYHGDTVLYVGEEPGTTSGDEDFVALLTAHWTVVETVDIPNWHQLHDRLVVYRRRQTA